MQMRRWMVIGWSSFLGACVLEFLVFACVDPADLHGFGEGLAWSRQTVYTVSFFVFWAVTLLSNALAVVLAMSDEELNDVPPGERG